MLISLLILFFENFKYCIKKKAFPRVLKHKKKGKHNKSNYKPVSILTNFPKIY